MQYKAGGDRLFWIEIAKQGNVIMINEPLNFFRQHEQKVSPQKAFDGTVYIEAFRTYNYLTQNNYINFTLDFFVRNHYACIINQRNVKSKNIKKN